MEKTIHHNQLSNQGYNPKFLYLGMIFIIFLEYLRLSSYFPFLNSVKAYVSIPTTIFLSTLIFSRGNISNKDIFLSPNFRILTFFLFTILLSLSKSSNIELSMSYLTGAVGYFFLFFIISKIIDNSEKFFGFFFSITALHLIIISRNIDIITNPHTRSYLSNLTFLGDGNDFALSLCITIPTCLYLVSTAQKKWLRYVCLVSLIILLLAVIGTQSRGASLALISLVLYYAYKSKKKGKLLFKLSLIILIIAVYAPSAYFNRLEHINNYQEASAQSRIKAWSAGIKMAKDNPFTGIGAGQYPIVYATKYPDKYNAGFPTTAHSTFFLALGELGYPGFIVVVLFFISNLLKNERLGKHLEKILNEQDLAQNINLLKTINASIIAYMVAGAFLSALYYPHMYLLAGVSNAARIYINKQISIA